MSKWGDRPHWHFEGTLLGTDRHGTWLGFPTGTRNERPGFAFDSEVDAVTLAPREGWFFATFHRPGIWCDLYVDVATPARWDGDVLRSVDLDLDVIRMVDSAPTASRWALPPKAPWGEVFIDDEDEFAEHQGAYGYPDDVVAAARASADAVLDAVRAGRAPFDGSHQQWLDRVTPLA
jgi:predicted RNA-binding protein associated with RNAse of E/G family